MMVVPTITGVSYRLIARKIVLPKPGHRNTVSVIVAPVNNPIMMSAKFVIIVGKVGRKI